MAESRSIGLMELKSTPVGLQTADEMLKAANVELLTAMPACPGKFVIIVSGATGAVKSSMSTGEQIADSFMICSHIINNVHESVPQAVLGLSSVERVASIGCVETIAALTVVRAADIAVKSSKISLMDVRIARGLGGKGVLLFTGEVSSVRAAIKAIENELGAGGDITSTCVIASPHKSLIEKLS